MKKNDFPINKLKLTFADTNNLQTYNKGFNDITQRRE